MRILADYRPALRERTGVGESLHGLVRAYAAAHPGEVTLFTSSWKDRPAPTLASKLGVKVVDLRIPVRVLNSAVEFIFPTDETRDKPKLMFEAAWRAFRAEQEQASIDESAAE